MRAQVQTLHSQHTSRYVYRSKLNDNERGQDGTARSEYTQYAVAHWTLKTDKQGKQRRFCLLLAAWRSQEASKWIHPGSRAFAFEKTRLSSSPRRLDSCFPREVAMIDSFPLHRSSASHTPLRGIHGHDFSPLPFLSTKTELVSSNLFHSLLGAGAEGAVLSTGSLLLSPSLSTQHRPPTRSTAKFLS